MTTNPFEKRLSDGVKKVQRTSPGVRKIFIIPDVGGGSFNEHPDSVMLAAVPILREIGKIYRYGDNIIIGKGNKIITIAEEGVPTKTAHSIMANHFLVQANEEDIPQPPSSSFLQHLFNSNLVLQELPMVKRYVKMPVYDENFNLLQPGYHPESGILVHGEPIEPVPFNPPDSVLPLKERAPAAIQEILADFPFATDTDFINTIGLILIALLTHIFTATGRAIGLLSGNQPGVGKTGIANVLGVILDGHPPIPTEFTTSNDELSKRILAAIRTNQQSVVFIDNARTAAGSAICSTSLEAMAVTDTLSLRILGSSTNHTQPNDFVWLISMNDMKTTPDLAQRGILVNLVYEGPTSLREYRHNDLAAFIKEKRTEIIAACYGMIEHWKAQGRPNGQASHRFIHMARIIGGILDACGLPGFLANHQEATQSINSTSDDLVALFEAVLRASSDSAPQKSETSFHVPNAPVPVGVCSKR